MSVERASRWRLTSIALAVVPAFFAVGCGEGEDGTTSTTQVSAVPSASTTSTYPDLGGGYGPGRPGPTPPATIARVAEPTCAGPYEPVDYVASLDGDWVDPPASFPEGVSGVPVRMRDSSRFWGEEPVVSYERVEPEADGSFDPNATYLLTLTYDGVTRTFTTAGNELGSHYTRTPGLGEWHGVGAVDWLVADDGAVFVTFTQSDSGTYAYFAWRFDDPCVS